VRTYNVKLIFENDEDKQNLIEIFELHKNIWNYLSEYIYKKQIKLSSKILQEQKYHQCRKAFKKAPSQLVVRAMHDVVSAFKSIKSNKQEITQAPLKKNLSIRLDKRLYTLKNDSVKLTTCGKRIICKLKQYDKVKELIQKYNICDPLIFVRNNEVFIALTFDNPEPIHNPNQCVGVDLGLNRIAVTSEGKIIKGKEFLREKRKIRYLKRCLNHAKKCKTKKTDSARKHLRKVKNREKNISKNYIHHLANELLKTKCNTIVLEDLSSLKKTDKGRHQNSRLSQVPFYILLMVLSYKAQALGKRVETVNPAYTSKDDFRSIERGKRVGCRYYASDKKVLDADLNASINIANRYARKVKLPVSFVFPSDGKYKLNGQASVNKPSESFGEISNSTNVLCL
jgi:IS605 OrfB family transposase